MRRPTALRVRATSVVVGATLLAGCSGASARGAGVAFWFVAAVALLFSVGVVALLGYLFVRLATSLWRDDGE